jgi:hypothetical protein
VKNSFLKRLQEIEFALDLDDPRKNTFLKKNVRKLKALILDIKKLFEKEDPAFDIKITEEMMK